MFFGSSSGLFFRDSGFQDTPYFIIRTHKETGKVKQHFLLGTKHATARFSDSVF
jgi:hypothetical protein